MQATDSLRIGYLCGTAAGTAGCNSELALCLHAECLHCRRANVDIAGFFPFQLLPYVVSLQEGPVRKHVWQQGVTVSRVIVENFSGSW